MGFFYRGILDGQALEKIGGFSDIQIDDTVSSCEMVGPTGVLRQSLDLTVHWLFDETFVIVLVEPATYFYNTTIE